MKSGAPGRRGLGSALREALAGKFTLEVGAVFWLHSTSGFVCLSVSVHPSVSTPSPRPIHTMRVTSLTQRSFLGLGIPRTPVTYPIRAAPCSSPVPGASYLEVTDVILAFSTW